MNLQAARLQFLAQEISEQQTAGAVAVVVGDEERVAGIVVVVVLIPPFVLPGLQQIVRHGVMMDRRERGPPRAVSRNRPCDQASGRRLVGDQKHRAGKTGIDQRLFGLLRERKIEGVFRYSTRAHGAGHVQGVTDIDRRRGTFRGGSWWPPVPEGAGFCSGFGAAPNLLRVQAPVSARLRVSDTGRIAP